MVTVAAAVVDEAVPKVITSVCVPGVHEIEVFVGVPPKLIEAVT